MRQVSQKVRGLHARTESTFVALGDELGELFSFTQELKDVFDTLGTATGPEGNAQRLALFGDLQDDVANVHGALTGFFDKITGLRSTLFSFQDELRELRNFAGTIDNLAVNAKILGAQLSPRRQQVDAFVIRLSEMSNDAGNTMQELSRNADAVMGGINAVNGLLEKANKLSKQGIEPTIRRMITEGRRRAEEFQSLAREQMRIRDINTKMNNAISHILQDSQFGDITRQRLERVYDITDDVAPKFASNEEKLMFNHYAAHLAYSACDEAVEKADEVLPLLDSLGVDSLDAVQMAEQLYMRNRGPGGAETDHLSDFRRQAELLMNAISDISQLLTALDAQFSNITQLEKDVRTHTHHIRISGLNAVIVCAKLGREGVALRELAQWLRSLTAANETSSREMAAVTEKLRNQTVDVSVTGRDEITSAVEHVRGRVDGLVASQDQADNAVRRAMDLFSMGKRRLEPIQECHALLEEYRNEVRIIRDGILGDHQTCPSFNATMSPQVQSALSGVIQRYTTEVERNLHRRVFGQNKSAPQPAAEVRQAAPMKKAAGAEDLGDIFF